MICEQQRRRSDCASAQSDRRLFCSLPGIIDIPATSELAKFQMHSLCNWAPFWCNMLQTYYNKVSQGAHVTEI